MSLELTLMFFISDQFIQFRYATNTAVVGNRVSASRDSRGQQGVKLHDEQARLVGLPHSMASMLPSTDVSRQHEVTRGVAVSSCLEYARDLLAGSIFFFDKGRVVI